MSRRVPRCLSAALLVALATAMTAPSPALGQQTEEELVQALDSLTPLVKSARAEAHRAREEYKASQDARHTTKEISVGLLRVLVIPGQESLAEEAVGRVWRREYATWLDRSRALGEDRIFFQWDTESTPPPFRSFDVRVVYGPRWRSRAYMEAGIRQVISESLKGDLARSGLTGTWAVPEVKPVADPVNLVRAIMVTPSRAVRACLEGSDAACLRALDLRTDDTPVDEWYTAAERRTVVTRSRLRFAGTAPAELRACERDGSTAACDNLLRDYLARWPRPQDRLWLVPLVGQARSSLLWYALNEGGTGAWGRLLDNADDGALNALEAASGMSGEELVAGWRTWLLDQQPVTRAGFGAVALKALLWVLLLFAFATRSTRWRLG